MWPPAAGRATPVSGETITKLVRQNYKPQSPEPYVHEVVQCRTDTTCQKSKPEDYWNTNFYRRQQNLQKGFYSSLTEPYRPIGGEVILDPYDLVQSALPDILEKKNIKLSQRRGTIFQDQKLDGFRRDDQSDKDSASSDMFDNCPSAGYNDIKKLLKETKNRIVSVRAGMPYEDHVKTIEEKSYQDMLASQPDETEMVLQSVSSMYIPMPCSSGSTNSRQSSGKSERDNQSYLFDKANRMLNICEGMQKPSQFGTAASFLKPPSSMASSFHKERLTLKGVSSGVTFSIQKKERLFRDHLNFLKSIYDMLVALHNMRVRDIRSKVPLCKDVVEKYRKETFMSQEEKLVSRGPNTALPKIGRGRRESTSIEPEGPEQAGKMSVFGVAKRLNLMDTANKNVFGRRQSKIATKATDGQRQTVETWEDLLNVQRKPYKEPEPITFNFGIVAKFMRWYRIASILPTHGGGAPDPKQLAHLQDISEKTTQDKPEQKEKEKKEKESGGTTQTDKAERVKKLPIWQQVAQEKSTVFHNSDIEEKEPDPDSTVLRFKKNMNKLKQNVEKENTAELEKMLRERVANFRLKFGTLNKDECSCLFEEQKVRIQDVKDSVNNHLENFDIQPSKWFEELKEQTSAQMFLQNQPEVAEIISKLQTYAHMDNKTISFAKAKLCLLMMSLPAYDICQIHVQKALKFIFENILLGQESQFIEWLNHRKIPYMLTDPGTSRSGVVSPFSAD